MSEGVPVVEGPGVEGQLVVRRTEASHVFRPGAIFVSFVASELKCDWCRSKYNECEIDGKINAAV